MTKQRLTISESKLREIVNATVGAYMNETSRRQKAQQAIRGKNRKVKTMAIISAQNPMGMQMDKDYNDRSHAELLDELKNGHFVYFVTKGFYDGEELSVIIYNISLTDTLKLCYRYNQESVIFIDCQGEDISYQYWEGDDHNSPLKLQHEESEIVDATNDDNYYTAISRHFKFRIPFFESCKKVGGIIDENCQNRNPDILIDECLDVLHTGKHKYMNRCKLYGRGGQIFL